MSQINYIDVTAPAQGEHAWTFQQVVDECNKWFKKYTFQKEKGEEGFLHWQIRGSLIKKRRVHELFTVCFNKGHISPTSNTVHKKNSFNYVMKADTRVDGPWTEESEECTEPPVMTTQLAEFLQHEKYPWQKQIEEMCKVPDFRKINVIMDKDGNSGKSIMVEYLEYHRLGFEVPPFRQMEDIMQCCMCVKAQKCYFIDMPRGMKKDRLGDFYSGLESLKNGVAYDKRYSFKKRRFNRPNIFVFTNTEPVLSLLSADRWKVWDMSPEKELIPRA